MADSESELVIGELTKLYWQFRMCVKGICCTMILPRSRSRRRESETQTTSLTGLCINLLLHRCRRRIQRPSAPPAQFSPLLLLLDLPQITLFSALAGRMTSGLAQPLIKPALLLRRLGGGSLGSVLLLRLCPRLLVRELVGNDGLTVRVERMRPVDAVVWLHLRNLGCCAGAGDGWDGWRACAGGEFAGFDFVFATVDHCLVLIDLGLVDLMRADVAVGFGGEGAAEGFGRALD